MDATVPEAYGFMHLWCPPKRALRGNTFACLTPQGRYLIQRSRARFARRAEAYRRVSGLTMELGQIDSIRFILFPASK